MPIRTILTLTGPDLDDGDLKIAASLCEEIDAHLAVLVVALAAPPPIGEYAAVVSDDWLREREIDLDRLRQRSASVTSLLSPRLVSSEVLSEYPEVGRAKEVVGRRARYADLTLVGPDVLSQDTLREQALDGALFSSGKPVLLVPRGAKPTLKPRTVVVAWDSSLEASNAVARSLDLLRGADAVRLALIDPLQGENRQGAEPGADAATYLARHGVKVSVDRLPSGGQPVAAVLRQHLVDSAADLLVMGAYGHSRLRERMFGGVTRSMIEDPPLAVLMAH